MKAPRVHYADSPDGKIAYQIVGTGPMDLVWASDTRWTNLDVVWEQPQFERYLRRLASFSRLILYNPRGTGLSDPIPVGIPPTVEEWCMDFRWILDAAQSERAAVLATDGGGTIALMSGASFPERIQSVALVDCYATLGRQDDYPWGMPQVALDGLLGSMVDLWGTGQSLRLVAPELADDERFREWYARLERGAASPSSVDYFRANNAVLDFRGVLPSINAPTLVVSHTAHAFVRLGHGRYLADHLPNARYIERPGFAGLPWIHDVDGTLDEVQRFFTGTKGVPDLDDRVLATVLFADIVGSTTRAAEIGDQKWRALLDEHDNLSRREIDRFRGRFIKSTGDGFLATFDGPARAIRCAIALSESIRTLGIEVRAGLHTGEIELRDQDVGGIAIHIAERVMGEAGAGEVFVSGAIPPLVAGSGIDFDDLGQRALKGVPGEWRLYSVKT
jgi:class 3 adenylate cyclase/pimeloyl-ACP methyl ester carboxylesterase